MGADLILYCIEVPEDTSGEAIVKAVEMCLGGLTADEADNYFSGDGDGYWDSWEEEVWAIGNPDDEDPDFNAGLAPDEVKVAAARKVLREKLVDAAGLLYSNEHRELARLNLPCHCGCGAKTLWAFTGGMSWGDDLDLADEFRLLDHFDLFTFFKSDLQHLADADK